MSQKTGEKLISVFIDDEEVRVPPGTNMIEAAASFGKEIPHYCYHPKLTVAGNCRMCLVELGMPGRDRATGEPLLDEGGNPKIMWMPGPAIACGTNAAPGMHIKTESDVVKKCRNGVMEFLLINHPLDCPICDQAGECHLQEYATDYGRGYSRFIEEKVVKPKRTRLGPRVMLDDERCILCSRCIRFCNEIVEDEVLGFIDRGSHSTLTCFPGRQLENNYSLNTVDICPVGALTSMDFRFKMRVWFLSETPSICTESSVGVNTLVGSREGKIYRITPRRNDEVNDTWMSDSGRLLYRELEKADRLTQYSIDGKATLPDGAAKEAADIMRKGKCAFVGSGRSSLEEQFLLQKIRRACGNGPAWLVGRTGAEDELLISADRNPNLRGALVSGLIDRLPQARLTELSEQIDADAVDTIVVWGEDLLEAGLTEEQLEKVTIVYCGYRDNATAAHAKVGIPGLSVFENRGCFINQQFRLQSFLAAVPGPEGVLPDVALLVRILNELDGEGVRPRIESIWQLMSDEIESLKGMTFAGIPEGGQLISCEAFKDLPFIEGKSLHYDPEEALAAAGG